MRDNIDESVGFYIKKYRQEKGLTQKRLGAILNVSQAMIAQYEKGIRHPKIETLRKMAHVLDVNLADFLEIGQTLVDDSEEGLIDSITKKSSGNVLRTIDTDISINNNAPLSSEYEDVIQKLKSLNGLGCLKAREYITDLAEQKKYLKKEPPTIK